MKKEIRKEIRKEIENNIMAAFADQAKKAEAVVYIMKRVPTASVSDIIKVAKECGF